MFGKDFDGRILIGKGVLSWPKIERNNCRYGAVKLMEEGMNSFSTEEGSVELINKPNPNQYGRLIAKVIQRRQSTHIGDLIRGFYPTTPNVGEEIILGEGYLFYDMFFEDELIGLFPDDGRIMDWLIPENLYRAHEQSVELYFESYNHSKETKKTYEQVEKERAEKRDMLHIQLLDIGRQEI